MSANETAHVGSSIEWVTDTSDAAWLVERIRGFAVDVGSLVPHGYEAYARIFHALEGDGPRRWSDLARMNGRIVHGEMQYHLIAHPPGVQGNPNDQYRSMSVGDLPERELRALVQVMAGHTSPAERCMFAVWEGFGQLQGGKAHQLMTRDGRGAEIPGIAPPAVLAGPKLKLPNRAYLLLAGTLEDVVHVREMLGRQSPNLWWPLDRSWCVATEIDLGYSYVGGSQKLIDGIVSCPELEALSVALTAGISGDSDLLNAALDPTR